MMERKDAIEASIERLGENTSVDIAHVKKLAKYMVKTRGISHMGALDQLAKRMGHANWRGLLWSSGTND